MGKLFIMPSKAPVERSKIEPPAATVPKSASIDFTVWLSAPRERTSDYFPVYSMVSRTMQTVLRQWAREWLREHPAAFERRIAAYSLLVFSCTRPYRGRPPHLFTYDLQQTATLDQAFRTARRLLTEELERIDDMQRAAGRHGVVSHMSHQIQVFVARNRRPIHGMFYVETALMDEVLKFTQINIPKIGLDNAVAELRSGFKRHLRRFSDLVDFDERTDDLLRIITEALRFGFDDGAAMGRQPAKGMKDDGAPAPNQTREEVPVALRAAESDEDVRLPAPNRDGEGAGVFNGADSPAALAATFQMIVKKAMPIAA